MADGVELGIEHLTDAEVIGRGGFSTVYAATNTLLGTRVAVKVLSRLESENLRRRFERECQVMGQLSHHPNVVTIHHAGYTSDDRPFLIMALAAEGALSEHLARRGRLPWAEVVDHLIPITEAVGAAHAAGYLHRDIKPENILLDGATPKLTDFGIARIRDAAGHTSTHITASWLHAPPETFANTRDERSDLYSLGSTLHTLVTGVEPFRRDDDESLNPLIYRLLNEPAPGLPADLAPPALVDLVARTLAKDPAERPQSADQVIEELRRIRSEADDGPAAAPGPAPTPAVPASAPATVPLRPESTTRVASPPEVVPAGTVAGAGPGGAETGTVVASALDGDGAGTVVGHDRLEERATEIVAPAAGPAAAPSPERTTGAPQAPGPAGIQLAGAGSPPSGDGPAAWRRLPVIGAALLLIAVAAVVASTRFGSDDDGSGEGGEDGSGASAEISDGQVVFRGHEGSVTGLAVTDDGAVVSASDDLTVQIWYPDDPEAPQVYEWFEGWVRSVDLLDGSYPVAASEDGTVTVWETESDESVTYEGHEEAVAAVIALDDDRVASGGEDSTVHVWDPEDLSEGGTGGPVVFGDHNSVVRSLAELDDGRIASASLDGTVRVWSPDDTGDSFVHEQSSEATAVAVLSDGRVVSGGGDGLIHIWYPDSDDGPVIFSGHEGDEVSALLELEDGRVASGGTDGLVLIWDPDDVEPDPVIYDGHDEWVRALAQLPDGRVVSGGSDDTVQVWPVPD